MIRFLTWTVGLAGLLLGFQNLTRMTEYPKKNVRPLMLHRLSYVDSKQDVVDKVDTQAQEEEKGQLEAKTKGYTLQHVLGGIALTSGMSLIFLWFSCFSVRLNFHKFRHSDSIKTTRGGFMEMLTEVMGEKDTKDVAKMSMKVKVPQGAKTMSLNVSVDSDADEKQEETAPVRSTRQLLTEG